MKRPYKPFRWNVANPALARRLGRWRSTRVPADLVGALLRVAAAAVRAAGDAQLVWVGRSPESLYDLLSGAFEATSWRERLTLLHLSLRGTPWNGLSEGARGGLRSYLEHLGLSPERIVTRERPTAFVDLVYSGETFGQLLELLHRAVEPERWPALRERLRWVCIVERGHPVQPCWTPEESSWTGEAAPGSVRCVPVDWPLWRYLANEQPKTSPSHRWFRWDRTDGPPTGDEHLSAARMARSVYRLGETMRARLAHEMGFPDVPEPCHQQLIAELRRASGR